MGKFFGKLALVFNIGVYVHRFFDGCNDLRYEFYNVKSGVIGWDEFFKQVVPTMMYHLSGEFQKKVAEMYKEEHIGLDKEA